MRDRLIKLMLKIHIESLSTTSAKYEDLSERLIILPTDTAELMAMIRKTTTSLLQQQQTFSSVQLLSV